MFRGAHRGTRLHFGGICSASRGTSGHTITFWRNLLRFEGHIGARDYILEEFALLRGTHRGTRLHFGGICSASRSTSEHTITFWRNLLRFEGHRRWAYVRPSKNLGSRSAVVLPCLSVIGYEFLEPQLARFKVSDFAESCALTDAFGCRSISDKSNIG